MGDIQGKYTCYTHNGTSTVDYAVISETMYAQISKNFVSTPNYRSDHCMLELEIKLPKNITSNNKEKNVNQIQPTLKWNSKDIELFRSHMESPCTNKQIKEIELCFIGNYDSVTNDDILKKNNFLYTYKSKIYSKRKLKPKKKSKKWYDYSCYEINRKMKSIAKMNQKDPTNMDIRRNLNIIKKQYKKLLKHKKREWNEQIISKLESLESDDPKQYWNLINELKKVPKE